MRTKKNPRNDRIGLADDAHEELWATQDYFWALKAGLLDKHRPAIWCSFRAGYAWQGNGPEPDHDPSMHRARRMA